MFRRILVCLLALCLLGGCSPATEYCPPALTDEVTVYEGEGYRLTYPAAFTLSRDTGEALYFTAEGQSMAFSLTREANTYGTLPIEGYRDAMGIHDGVIEIDAHSFGVERHIPNMLSGYFLYTVTEEYIYLLEYNYGGTEEERALSSLFSVEAI